jgi:hypothetical protein
MTDSMKQAIGETNRRRAKQEAYNREHNITPLSIVKSVDMQLARIVEADYVTVPLDDVVIEDVSTEAQLLHAIGQLESQMREAAKNFEFERAAALRDRIRSLKQRDLGAIFSVPPVVEIASTCGPAQTNPEAEAAGSPAQDHSTKPVKKRAAKKISS